MDISIRIADPVISPSGKVCSLQGLRQLAAALCNCCVDNVRQGSRRSTSRKKENVWTEKKTNRRRILMNC